MNFTRKLFEKPSAHVIAQQTLDEHMRQLLVAQQDADLARNTVQYHVDSIARLPRFLTTGVPEVV